MGFFSFRRKFEAAEEYSLEDIPLFSQLTSTQQRNIQKKARLIECKRGDIIYQEGTPGDAFYVIISGRFRLFAKSREHPDGETMFILYRSEHFGEASLLSGSNHTVSVEATRNGRLLKFDKDDFLKLVKDIPSISLYLNRSMGHRWIRSDEGKVESIQVKIASLISQDIHQEATTFWFDFAAQICRETSKKVIIVDFFRNESEVKAEGLQGREIPELDLQTKDPSQENQIMKCLVGADESDSGYSYLNVFIPDEGSETIEKKLDALLTFLTYRYDYLLLRLPPNLNHLSAHTLKRSDLVYLYVAASMQSLSHAADCVNDLHETFGFREREIKVIVQEEYESGGVSFDEKQRLLGLRIFKLLPSKNHKIKSYKYGLRFMAREFVGNLVGLALGSGAAYGLAHIGVLRVLERENIQVDVVTGSSMGALIGAYWGAGFSADKMEEIAKSINRRNAFFKLVGFRDLCLPHQAFIKGNQIVKFIETFFGDKTFQDLERCLKIVATNLFNSEEIVFESGRIVDALRASISIPAIFRPFKYRGDYLIDGGVIDPLPVGILSNMGVKKIIAVNVLTSGKDRREGALMKKREKYAKLRSLASDKNLIGKGIRTQKIKLEQKQSTSLFNVLMNTIQFMEYELAQIAANDADILLHPEVEEGHWAQFYTPQKFIKAGERVAEEQIEAIRQLIVE